MLEILGTIFAIGAMGFWILLAIETCVLLALIENEKPFWATFMMIGTLTFLHTVGSFSVVAFAGAHPLQLALYVGGYFVAGTVWSVVKWWFYVNSCREKYDEMKALFLESHGVTGNTIPEGLLAEWHRVVTGARQIRLSNGRTVQGGDPYRTNARNADQKIDANIVIPRARDHKSKVMLWMCYWPWSMVWTLINDQVKRLFREIYRRIQGLLQSISNRAFRGVDADFREPPPPPPAPPGTEADPYADPHDGNNRSRRGLRDSIG